MKKVLRKLVQGVMFNLFGIAVLTSVAMPMVHAQTGIVPSTNLGVSLGSPLIEGSLVTRTVQLNQTEVRFTVIEALKKLREEMWDINPNYNGKKLQEVAKEAGLTTKELYATGMKWDQTLEKKAIQRATESSIIAAHKRLDLSQYDIGYENLAWGYSVESAIVNGWGYGELDSLNTAKGEFNADNGHLHTQLNPYLLSFGVANINGVTAGVYNRADSKDLNGTDLTGNYAVTLKVANELTEVKGTLVYRGNTALIPAVTGLIKHTDGQTYYVENGEVKKSFTGLADVVVSNGESNRGVHALQVKTAYIHDGKFNSSISGIVVLNNKELVYLTNGFVNKEHVGVVSYGNQSYNVKNGKAILVQASENTLSNMYRLYNPQTKMHFYTMHRSEINLLQSRGWIFEGVAWRNVTSANGTPVYRVYNKQTGERIFTRIHAELEKFKARGWINEGIAFRMPNDGQKIYRLVNKTTKQYALSAKLDEIQKMLTSGQWINEGVAFFAAFP